MSSVDISESMMKAVFPAFDGLGLAFPERRTRPRKGVVAKRRLDIAVAGLAIVLLLPLLALVALVIKLDSKGPVLFTQRRTGLGGRVFHIHKFRSMHVMEDGAQMQQASQGDARITRAGRLLRKLSLDELPQLLNILKGDMSVVGIRPLLSVELAARPMKSRELYAEMRPGLTGLWQVAGRSSVRHEDRFRLDDNYVTHWTLRRDLALMARTPMGLLRASQTA